MIDSKSFEGDENEERRRREGEWRRRREMEEVREMKGKHKTEEKGEKRKKRFFTLTLYHYKLLTKLRFLCLQYFIFHSKFSSQSYT